MKDLRILLAVTLINYLAQIPYYFHNYYNRYHIAPSLSAVALLSLTLAWFMIGYIGYQKKWKYGYGFLLSFLTVEAVFYLHTLTGGAIAPQLHNHSNLIKAVFIVGYISGLTAGWYAYLLIKQHKRRSL